MWLSIKRRISCTPPQVHKIENIYVTYVCVVFCSTPQLCCVVCVCPCSSCLSASVPHLRYLLSVCLRDTTTCIHCFIQCHHPISQRFHHVPHPFVCTLFLFFMSPHWWSLCFYSFFGVFSFSSHYDIALKRHFVTKQAIVAITVIIAQQTVPVTLKYHEHYLSSF